jgi:hypothetical protein
MERPTMGDERVGPRKRIAGSQSGQIILLYLFFLLPMTMICFSVFNVGQIVAEKMKVQNAADNAAYSAATWEARYMNLTAYTSRAMVANYDTMATIDAVWSMMDSLDGFIFILENVLKIFFDIGEALQPVHMLVAEANDLTGRLVGGNGKNGGSIGIERPIEIYSDFLSMLQVALYVATQFGRNNVIKSVAWSTDPNIQYNMVAEINNALSLDNRVKWDKTDKQNGLRLTTERSLNDFSNGESFRELFKNALPDGLGKFTDFTISLLICDLGLKIGPKGFNGPFFDHKTGSTSGAYSQDDDTVIIQPDKIYQHDFFGVSVKLCVTSIEFGHHSDDASNSGLALPHIVDVIDHDKSLHADNFGDNGIDCSTLGGAAAGQIFGPSGPFQSLSSAAQVCKLNDAQCKQDISQGKSPSVPCTGLPFPQGMADVGGDGLQTCNDINDKMEDMLKSLKNTVTSALGNPCATIYEWGDKLEDVKVTTYRGDDDVQDGRRIEGPTVFVYFRKKSNVLPMFQGLGLTNPNDIEAYSMAKVYYTQRVGDRTDNPCTPGPGSSAVKGGNRKECNRESLFNPFWAARLERPNIAGISLLH